MDGLWRWLRRGKRSYRWIGGEGGVSACPPLHFQMHANYSTVAIEHQRFVPVEGRLQSLRISDNQIIPLSFLGASVGVD
jgi:hypothetical protein